METSVTGRLVVIASPPLIGASMRTEPCTHSVTWMNTEFLPALFTLLFSRLKIAPAAPIVIVSTGLRLTKTRCHAIP